MKKLSLWTATLVIFAMLPALSFAKDHTYKGQIMDSACAKVGNHDAGYKMTGTHTPKDCTIACVNAGSKFVLYNPARKTAYVLDDQSQAKEFAGQNVKVEGTLDRSTHTIHVDKIAGAS